jgi:uncharacterized protein
MPHRCAGCKTLFPDVEQLKDGCPVCGSGKFIFVTGKNLKDQTVHTGIDESVKTRQEKKRKNNYQKEKTDPEENQDPASIESIRILEPGRYDLNLSRLAESDDRVVRIGSEDSYRLDLNSMIRQKRKK